MLSKDGIIMAHKEYSVAKIKHRVTKTKSNTNIW